MRAVVTETDKSHERVREYLRQCVEDCKPLLDKGIPLAVPMAEDHTIVVAYFNRKHMRHGEGTYWLHQTRPGGNTGRQKMKWRGWV